MGPCAANEYAVDPVGVATIKPSPVKHPKSSFSIIAFTMVIRVVAPIRMTASFKAKWGPLERGTFTSSMIRSLTAHRFSKQLSSTSYI